MADNNRITLQIRGADEDNGDVRFDDFIKQLNAVKNALSETERVISQGSSGKPSVYFKVVDLRHNSPASVVLEAVPLKVEDAKAGTVVAKFFSSLQEIERGQAPSGFDFPAFQAYRDMTTLLGKKITEIRVSRNGDISSTLDNLARNVDTILGPDQFETGSVTGTLEQINVHAGQNVFTIYPTSLLPKLRCIFPNALRKQAIQAVDRYVRVFGQMKTKQYLERAYPYEMLVRSIEIYPPEDELPSLGDLRGIGSSVASNIASEDAVRRLRDEW